MVSRENLRISVLTLFSTGFRLHRLDQVFGETSNYTVQEMHRYDWHWKDLRKIARNLTKLAIRLSHSWPTTNWKLLGLRGTLLLPWWSPFYLLCDVFELFICALQCSNVVFFVLLWGHGGIMSIIILLLIITVISKLYNLQVVSPNYATKDPLES